MNPELSDEAHEYGDTVRRALEAAGGDQLVQQAEADPAGREALVAPVLAELGAWDLDVRAGGAEAEAAAVVCRSAGWWALPYPVAERLARPVDLDVDVDVRGLVVVGDGDGNGGARPYGRVAGLAGTWATVTTDGWLRLATPAAPCSDVRKAAFVTRLALLPDRAQGEPGRVVSLVPPSERLGTATTPARASGPGRRANPLSVNEAVNQTAAGPPGSAAATESDVDPGLRDVALGIVLPCWTLLGVLDRAVSLTCAYVRERRQFGQALASFQGVQFQLTEAEVERAGVAELAKHALWSLEAQPPGEALADALALRLAAIEAAEVVFRVAHQLHGAIGFCDETTLSWLSRHSQPLRRLPLGPSATVDRLTRHVGHRGLAGLFDEPDAPVTRSVVTRTTGVAGGTG